MGKKEKILIIGNTGFIGSWLTIYYAIKKEANIFGISYQKENIILQNIIKKNNLINKQYIFNAQNFKKLEKTIENIKPDIVYQLAASPLVEEGIKYPYKTFYNNFTITLNVLEILTNCKSCKRIINFSSDKCYEPTKKKIIEDDKLGGKEPYSLSKAASEMVLKGYQNKIIKKNQILINIRAGNVIGGGDTNYNRIIPELNKIIFNKKKTIYLTNPNSSRPWLYIYDLLTILYKFHKIKFTKGYYNFNIGSNNNLKVKNLISKYLFFNSLKLKIKKSKTKKYENEDIILNCNKLKKIIDFKFTSLKKSLKLIYEWEYHYHNKRKSIFNLTSDQINEITLNKKNH